MTQEEKQETKKIFADLELFKAKVEVLREGLEEKTREVLGDDKDEESSIKLSGSKEEMTKVD